MIVNAFHLLDKIIFGTLLQYPTEDQINELVDTAKKKSEDHAYDMIDKATEDLDSKTAALLTHISILVAGLLVMFSSSTGTIKSIFLIELCLYLFLAILCLRTIRFVFTYINDRGINMNNNYVFTVEFYKRGQLYIFASSATIYVTLALIMTLIGGGIF